MTENELVERLRAGLSDAGRVREVKMFGGLGFMLNGHLIAGASRRGLLIRVGQDGEREALALPAAHRLEMRGREMPGYIRIELPALSAKAVATCLRVAVPHVQGLPAKRTAKKKTPKKKTKR
ncbi:MAG TPA: TfoX/Sxy family protein [Vicinamibacterales bacterium]|nr:TfoX/Sxy family protein [Vicinamibacterales bacterium]